MFNTNLKLSLCRTCLATLLQTEIYNIFTTKDLAKKLCLCSGYPVECTDEYPENICLQCYKQITLFYEFQQMCCNSLDTYHELLKNKETLIEANVENDNYPENLREDPLTDACKFRNPLKDNIIESTKSLQSLNESFDKKKRKSQKAKKNLKTQNLVRKTVIKSSRKSTGEEDTTTVSVLNVERIDKLKDHVQFDEDSEEYLEIGHSCGNEELLGEQFYKNSIKTQEEVSNLSKEHTNERRKAKSPTDMESCSAAPACRLTHLQNHQCEFCSKRFKSLIRLQAHTRQHNGLAAFLCNFEGCGSSFDRLYFYKKHQKEHNAPESQESFKCDLNNCERSYKSKSNLNLHKRKFHNLGPQLKTHMCEICGKVFRSSAVLNDHHYTHIERTQLPYACEEEGCSKRFSNKEKLKIHKLRHAGIKKFICPHCGMRKTTRNELKIHINYHTLERTWPCRFCNKVFNSAGNLKMHVKNMHEGAKDFACRYCDRTFAKADTKKYHEMTHTGEKPHECKECGRRFLQPAALRTHRKVHLSKTGKLAEKRKSPNVTISAENIQSVERHADEVKILTESIVAELLNEANNDSD